MRSYYLVGIKFQFCKMKKISEDWYYNNMNIHFKKIKYVSLAALGLHCCARVSLVAESGGLAGFSLRWHLSLQSTGSRACGLQ